MTLRSKRHLLSLGVLATAIAGAAFPSVVAAATYDAGCQVSPNPYFCTYQNATQFDNGTPSRTQYCQPTTLTNLPQPVDYIMTSCPTRAWLHQHANGSGWSLCINPDEKGAILYPPYRNPGNIQITSNPNHC
jgi:hypothetical protein